MGFKIKRPSMPSISVPKMPSIPVPQVKAIIADIKETVKIEIPPVKDIISDAVQAVKNVDMDIIVDVQNEITGAGAAVMDGVQKSLDIAGNIAGSPLGAQIINTAGSIVGQDNLAETIARQADIVNGQIDTVRNLDDNWRESVDRVGGLVGVEDLSGKIDKVQDYVEKVNTVVYSGLAIVNPDWAYAYADKMGMIPDVPPAAEMTPIDWAAWAEMMINKYGVNGITLDRVAENLPADWQPYAAEIYAELAAALVYDAQGVEQPAAGGVVSPAVSGGGSLPVSPVIGAAGRNGAAPGDNMSYSTAKDTTPEKAGISAGVLVIAAAALFMAKGKK